MERTPQITNILHGLERGDRDALNALIPLVYNELKKLARIHLRREATPAEATALVHETFLKLSGSRHPSYENRSHFYGIASRLMRQVLVDTARAKSAQKRSAGQEVALSDIQDPALPPDRSLLALDAALQWLEKADPYKGRLIEMHYFGGMTAEESAVALSIPVHRIRRDLRLAHAFLRRELSAPPHSS